MPHIIVHIKDCTKLHDSTDVIITIFRFLRIAIVHDGMSTSEARALFERHEFTELHLSYRTNAFERISRFMTVAVQHNSVNGAKDELARVHITANCIHAGPHD